MKVLHLCVKPSVGNGFGGGVGGYSTYTMRLKELDLEFRSENVENIFVGVTHPFGWKLRWFEFVVRFTIDVIKCFAVLVYIRPDILHIHGLYWRSTFREVIFVLAAKVVRVKV